jgi:hypothetical protein
MVVKISLVGFLKKKLKLINFANNPVNRTILKKVFDEAEQQIKNHTAKGYGVNTVGGPQGKFQALKPATIKNRRKNKDKLAPGVGPTKSRLTFTGQMLASLTYRLRSLSAQFYFKGRHKGSKISNADLAEIHDKGLGKMPKRPFARISGKEKKTLENILRRELKNKLRELK